MNKKTISIGVGTFIAIIILATPAVYDTDETYVKIANQYGDAFTQRGASEVCENDPNGLGINAVSFGVVVIACHDEWFVLFNTFPIHIMDAGDSSGR